ncbi:MAG TPA: HD domain-containing protein [Stellaceae bacterium]|nr:HD domain-containing protein [Stellaceae bacterium]
MPDETGRASPAASHTQGDRRRIIYPPAIGTLGTPAYDKRPELMAELGPDTVMMMGDNPALPSMPEKPRLVDFFRLRFHPRGVNHMLQSASLARKAGIDEKLVLACLLHDIGNVALVGTDHGYWGAQLIGPYVDEEVAWAVRHHQALRFFADEAAGYAYPEAYLRYFGLDYVPPPYIQEAHQDARAHRWYMSARLITIYDVYAFDPKAVVDLDEFTDIIARHFKEPAEGLGFDGSPVAHMWRSIIWPNNFL